MFNIKEGIKSITIIALVLSAFLAVYQMAYAINFKPQNSLAATPQEVLAVQGPAIPPQFTADDLKVYNGQKGQAAYVAVSGIVYDVSKVGQWSTGSHMGAQAGTDVTTLFKQSPHAMALLESLPQVGILVESKTLVQNQATPESGLQVVAAAPRAVAGSTSSKPVDAATSPLWTLQAVAPYNGTKGLPAYIVVKNTIYDVSAIGTWKDGSHKGIKAGTDVTTAFANSPHATSILGMAKVVAKIGDPITTIIANSSSQGSAVSSATNPTSSTSLSNAIQGSYDDSDHDEDDEEDDDDDDDDDHDDDEDDHDDDDND